MQQTLEQALDRAEYIIESARQRPPKRKYVSGGRKSIFQKLYDLYVEECEKEPEVKKLRRGVNLLEKLMMQESLSCLVVNLYPGNEGYSLMLRGKNGSDSETIRLPYEEGELLEYLDAEELPPILVDLLEKSQVNIFHSGCVIAEVRDYRQSSDAKAPGCQSRHILLRPTMQTLICDVHSITSDNHKWTQEDKLLLESQLILATAEPLCLDPSVAVACTANRLLYNRQKMSALPLKRSFRRSARSALARQQEVAQGPPPPQLQLLDFLQKRKERKAGQHYDLKISKAGNCVDMWKRSPSSLAAPSEVDVEKYARVELSIKPDEAQPSVWPAHGVKDDYVFESEAGAQKTKLTIMQSLGDPLYYGKIQPCKEEEEAEGQESPPHSSTDDHSNWFVIGSKTDAERVVSQYQELVQSEAKCPVKVSHSSSCTAGPGQPSPRREVEPEAPSLQPTMLGKAARPRPPPASLPSGSGSSAAGNYFTPQQASSFLKSPTPPPTSKPASLSRKCSADPSPGGVLSPAALSPASSSQRTPAPPAAAPPAALHLVNVVGSACGVPALRSGPGPVLGAAAPAGVSLSGLLPGTLPGAVPAAPAGVPFGLKNTSSLRPLNLLQLPGGSLIFNPLQQQQQQLPPFPPQQPGEQGSEQGPAGPEQVPPAPHAASLGLAAAGGLVRPQAAPLPPLGSAEDRPEPSPQPSACPPPQMQQLRFLQHQVAAAEAAPAAPRPRHAGSQSKSKAKRGAPTTPKF